MAEGHMAAGGCGGHMERWTPTEDNRKGVAGYICNSSKRRGRKKAGYGIYKFGIFRRN